MKLRLEEPAAEVVAEPVVDNSSLPETENTPDGSSATEGPDETSEAPGKHFVKNTSELRGYG